LLFHDRADNIKLINICVLSGGSRCLVSITVCLGILCLLLIAAVILQYFQYTSKRG